MDMIKWENGIISFPPNADWVGTLDKAGEDGWEYCGVLGIDPATQNIRVAVKRHKRTITLATEMPGGLVRN
jgi:hypothetical protein